MQLAFGTGILYGTPLTDAFGNAIAVPTPVRFGNLQDVSIDMSNDTKMLYGAFQDPIAAGRGKRKIEVKAKTANFNAAMYGALFLGITPVAGLRGVVDTFAASVPAASTYTITITPPSTGTFLNDLGVLYALTGLPLTRVASAPTTGQYSEALGVYTFAAGDASASVLISYEYTAVSTTGPKTIAGNNLLMGYAPSFQCTINIPFAGKMAEFVFYNCLASKFSFPAKNDDFSIPEFDFMCLANAAGQTYNLAFAE